LRKTVPAVALTVAVVLVAAGVTAIKFLIMDLPVRITLSAVIRALF